MSSYGDYMSEVYGKNIEENDFSLVVWTMKDDMFYLEDIYIKPKFRNMGYGKELMKEISKLAKDNGCTKLLGSITMLCRYKDDNMAKFLKYGFKLHSLGENIIYLIKEL